MSNGDTSSLRQARERSHWHGYIIGAVFAGIIGACFAFIPTGSAVAPDPIALKVQGPDTIGNAIPSQTQPPGAAGTTSTQLASSSANAAAGNNNSLGAVANQTTYVTGFQITGGGATAGSNIAVTLSNIVGASQNYVIVVPTGATTSITPLVVRFNPPLAASAPNTIITLSVPSFGAGNTAAAVAIQGFRQ